MLLNTTIKLWQWPVILALTSHALAQSSNSSTSDDSNDNPLCNSTLGVANGTGIFTFNPGILIPSRDPPPDLSWLVTALGGVPVETNAQLAYWLDTGGQNYSDSLDLGYDVCAMTFEPAGVLNNTDARSQYDNGSCLATFDTDCVTALRQQSEDLAFQLTGFPTPLPDSNLTADSLPTVCDSIGQSMSSALPKECKPYINETEYLVYGQGLTTNYKTSGLFFGGSDGVCTIKGSNQTFNLIDGYDASESGPGSHIRYDRMSWTVLPTITVFMPVANARRDVSMDYARSVVNCLHIDHYNQGSRVPAAPPQPTSVYLGGGGLSKGAIAGIVVGSVVGVGLIVAAAGFCWWRKRRARHTQEPTTTETTENVYPEDKPSHVGVLPAEFGDENALREIDSKDPYKSELPGMDARDPVELAGSMVQTNERDNRVRRDTNGGVNPAEQSFVVDR
ncbi:hypothetical protein Q7P37_009632 [Cladosporium fusiforme]